MKKSIVFLTLIGGIFLAGCMEPEEKTQDQLDEELRVALKDKASLSTVRDLIEQGADVNKRYEVPYTTQPEGPQIGFITPLSFPVSNGTGSDVSIIKELVDAGADAAVVFDDGSTLMHLAVLTERNGDIIRFLAQSGTPVDMQNALKQTPLFQAVYNENASEIEALIEAGADPNVRDADGQTIYEMAQRYQKQAGLEALRKALGQ
ncbi:MAG: ankyrin repeat domain-containing protein [Candidatus Babeliales bacterium]